MSLFLAEFVALVETLESLRMSTDALISKYYQERHEEQDEGILPTKAHLVARVRTHLTIVLWPFYMCACASWL